MPFVGMPTCQICGHKCHPYISAGVKRLKIPDGCPVDGCESMPSPDGGNPYGAHYHCGFENEHGICTTIGCMPERENLL
jgi:hypothetical protein